MQNQPTLALTIVFAIIAISLSTVVFPDDRMVVKLAMFACGVATGAALVGTLRINQRTEVTSVQHR